MTSVVSRCKKHSASPNGEDMRVKRFVGIGLILLAVVLLLFLIGTGGKKEKTPKQEEKKENIVIGFSQLGAESDWRSANTQSMLAAFTAANGYELIYDDGQQSQTKQITAIRRFIQQDVDYIVLAPVTENGWDIVLQEARVAGIPVIIVDRQVNVSDQSLYTAWVGSDFELEGKKLVAWLHEYTISQGISAEELNIVNLQGTLGATAQIGRTKGLEDAVEMYGWNLLAEEPADFTQTKGREVMARLLKNYDNINVVYCENDNSAIGAIEAIEAAGKKAGNDIKAGEIMVISFDGVNAKALSYVLDGRISCIAECNPLHGPRVQQIIEVLEAGKTPDKQFYVSEKIYSAIDTFLQVPVDGIKFDVTIITEKDISEK